MAAPGFLAVDIGGTKLAAGIVSHEGELLTRDQVPTPETGVWAALAGLVASQRQGSPIEVTSCGVGCGGPMEPGGERVSPLHITEWRGFPLRRALAESTGLRVVVANDAQALILGETWCGAVAGCRDAVGAVVSTGVGGGIVSGGTLVTGRLGNAGHVGHVIVVPGGRRCACGARGCLEAHASGTAIREATGRHPSEASSELRREVGALVGRGLVTVGALLDLRTAVVGGSVALGYGDDFFVAAQEEADRCAGLEFIRGFRVLPVGLGDRAPLVGAAAVARSATSV